MDKWHSVLKRAKDILYLGRGRGWGRRHARLNHRDFNQYRMCLEFATCLWLSNVSWSISG